MGCDNHGCFPRVRVDGIGATAARSYPQDGYDDAHAKAGATAADDIDNDGTPCGNCIRPSVVVDGKVIRVVRGSIIVAWRVRWRIRIIITRRTTRDVDITGCRIAWNRWSGNWYGKRSGRWM